MDDPNFTGKIVKRTFIVTREYDVNCYIDKKSREEHLYREISKAINPERGNEWTVEEIHTEVIRDQ